MRHYCHYHPVSPAKWHCQSCLCYFDNACAIGADEKRQSAVCPHCKVSMRYYRDKAVKMPFWQNSAEFFRLPLKVEPMSVVILVTLAASLISLFPTIGIPVVALLTWVVTACGLSLMANFAAEPNDGVSLRHLLSHLDLTRSVVLSGIFLVGGAFLAAAVSFSHAALASFIFVIMVTVLPTLILSLSIEDSLASAFQPQHLVRGFLKMGGAYLGLVSYAALVCFSALVIRDFADQHIPQSIYPSITAFTTVYFAFCLFGMMGYIRAEYEDFKDHAELDPIQPRQLSDSEQSPDSLIDMSLKQGKYLDALELLESDLKRNPGSDYRRNQLLKLALVLNDTPRIEKHLHGILRMLVGRNQISFAVQLIQQVRDHNPHFMIYDLPLAVSLATHFDKLKQDDLVLWLAQEAHTRFDKDIGLAELYLIAAKVCLSRAKKASLAASYLDFITENFASEHVARSAEILQAHIRKYSTA